MNNYEVENQVYN